MRLGRGSFRRLVMCESQAYMLTVCCTELLLNPRFLGTPSSQNKSSSKCVISTSPYQTLLFILVSVYRIFAMHLIIMPINS